MFWNVNMVNFEILHSLIFWSPHHFNKQPRGRRLKSHSSSYFFYCLNIFYHDWFYEKINIYIIYIAHAPISRLYRHFHKTCRKGGKVSKVPLSDRIVLPTPSELATGYANASGADRLRTTQVAGTIHANL